MLNAEVAGLAAVCPVVLQRCSPDTEWRSKCSNKLSHKDRLLVHRTLLVLQAICNRDANIHLCALFETMTSRLHRCRNTVNRMCAQKM